MSRWRFAILGSLRANWGRWELSYVFDECSIVITFENESVKSIGLEEISDHCTFDLSKFFPNRKLGFVHTLKFGDLSGKLPSQRFYPKCLSGCTLDPYINAHYEGNRSDLWLEIVAKNSYPYRGLDPERGFSELGDDKKSGPDIYYDTGCDSGIRKAARYAFATSQFKSISIGTGFDDNPGILWKGKCDPK